MNAVTLFRCRWFCRRLAGGVVAALLTVIAFAPARAQTVISITNAGFESPVLPGPTEYSEGVPSWNIYNGSSGAGVFSTALAGTTPPAIEGVQMAYVNSGITLYQVTSAVFGPNLQYSLSGYVGHRGNDTNTTSTIGAVQVGAYSGGIFYPAFSVSATVTSDTLTFSPVSGSSLVLDSNFYGESVAIAVVNQGSSLALFDDIHLTVTAVPEPATYVAWVGAAALGVAWYRRRKLAGA